MGNVKYHKNEVTATNTVLYELKGDHNALKVTVNNMESRVNKVEEQTNSFKDTFF